MSFSGRNSASGASAGSLREMTALYAAQLLRKSGKRTAIKFSDSFLSINVLMIIIIVHIRILKRVMYGQKLSKNDTAVSPVIGRYLCSRSE